MTTETKHMPSEQEIEAATDALVRFSTANMSNARDLARIALTAASRAPDQSKRIRELEAALTEARKVIGALISARSPAEIRAADDDARDWLTRNSESSNAK